MLLTASQSLQGIVGSGGVTTVSIAVATPIDAARPAERVRQGRAEGPSAGDSSWWSTIVWEGCGGGGPLGGAHCLGGAAVSSSPVLELIIWGGALEVEPPLEVGFHSVTLSWRLQFFSYFLLQSMSCLPPLS
ncbi:unnamed protein product [Arctogadus glacialis]